MKTKHTVSALALLMSIVWAFPGMANDQVQVCIKIQEHNERKKVLENSARKIAATTPTTTPPVASPEPTQTTQNTAATEPTPTFTATEPDSAAPAPTVETPPATVETPPATAPTTDAPDIPLPAPAMPPTMSPMAPTSGTLPRGQKTTAYLKRLIEHYVTHADGYESVDSGCEQTITVELYPLQVGWTVFARYSGTAREEKVDQLFPDELNAFAERAVTALLRDVPISATITRDNVLKDDSRMRVQRVKGSSHFIIEMGTRLMGAKVEQVVKEGDNAGSTKEEFTIFHPIEFGLGYRGRFENWGLSITNHLGIGLSETSASSNPEGGHVDYGGDVGIAIQFLRYKKPRGLTSFYGGAGASFDLLWFRLVNPPDFQDDHSFLFGGGLSGQGVIGWEFMRAAVVQFYLQAALNIPAYLVRTENNAGQINSWMPGISIKFGMVF